MAEPQVERRAFELRSEGRQLSGTVMPYGRTGQIGGFTEEFAPSALRFGDVILNVQHDRGRPLARTGETLKLFDSAEAVTMQADLPAIREADDTLILVRAGVLRGLSVEFRALDERWDGNHRTVLSAELTGIAVVDRGAYADAVVEARMKESRPRSISEGRGTWRSLLLS